MNRDILNDLGVGRLERRRLIKAMAKRLGPFEFEERPDLETGPSGRSLMAASGIFWCQEKKEKNG